MDIRFYFDGVVIPYNELKLNGDAKIIIEKIYSYIVGRLKIIENEMNEEPNGYIWIDIGTPELRSYYSKPISDKVMESVTEVDFKRTMYAIYLSLNQQ